MNEKEQYALETALIIFERSCQKLIKHRNPNIHLTGNAELLSDWFKDGLDEFKIITSGANSHPDYVINGVGFELKSLKTTGQIQFNSTVPCGGFRHSSVRHGSLEGECYYVIAKYTEERNYGYLEDYTICDGDFFNFRREWAFSHANHQETGYGNFGDGVCRYRKMYSFPSPQGQVKGISFISKFKDLELEYRFLEYEERIVKLDQEKAQFPFYVYRYRNLEN